MSNLYDFTRLSTFVGGIVDRKVKSISLSITSSTSYLKLLVAQAAASASAALGSQTAAQASASQANSLELSTAALWANFTSIYLGVNATDPTKSIIGGPVSNAALYVRAADGRLRYATVSNNVVTWQDATIAADQTSVINICNNRFLSLSMITLQAVAGPVTFNGVVTVQPVPDWSNNSPPTATQVQALVTAETNRATAAEGTNATAVANETSRAKAAESANATAIGNNSTAITNETNRAKAAEAANATAIGNNATAISNEHTRAVTAENILINFANLFSYGSNTYGYWETRPGIMEQWGYVAQTAGADEPVVAVTLPLAAADATYHIQLTPVLNNPANNEDTWVQIIKSSKTTTGFSAQYQRPGTSTNSFGLDGFEWRIIAVVGETDNNIQSYNTSTGTTSGGTGSGPAPTTQCPEYITPVLLANAARNGPGNYVIANDLREGDYVWTQHEYTMDWGAHKVIQSRPFDAILWEAPNYFRSTKGHPLYINNKWTAINEIGVESGDGIAVAISIEDARTFITLDLNGNQVLNHNIKPSQN